MADAILSAERARCQEFLSPSIGKSCEAPGVPTIPARALLLCMLFGLAVSCRRTGPASSPAQGASRDGGPVGAAVRTASATLTSVAVNGERVLALDASGGVWAWRLERAAASVGPGVARFGAATRLGGFEHVAQIAAMDTVVCALGDDGHVRCSFTEIGQRQPSTPRPQDLTPGGGVSRFALGGDGPCGLCVLEATGVRCAFHDTCRSLVEHPALRSVPGVTDVAQLCAGAQHG